MPRGDFRGSISTLIQSPQIKVHNAGQAAASFRPVPSNDTTLSGVVDALDGLKNDLGRAAVSEMREEKAEAKREMREGKAEAKAEAKAKVAKEEASDLKVQEWKASAAYKSWLLETQLKMQEDPALSRQEFEEKYGEGMPALDLTGVTNDLTQQKYMILQGQVMDDIYTARAAAAKKGQRMEDFAGYVDASVPDEGGIDFKNVLTEGQSVGLNETERWTGVLSTLHAQMTEGNPQHVVDALEFATDNISDPELRTSVLKELTPMTRTATKKVKAKRTLAEQTAMQKAQTVNAVKDVIANSDKEWSAEAQQSNFARAEKHEITTNLYNDAEGILDTNGDYAGYVANLTRTYQVEGVYGNHEIAVSKAEAEAKVDAHFLKELREDPIEATRLVKESSVIPKVLKASVKGVLEGGFNTNSFDPLSPDFGMFLMAEKAMEGDRSGFVQKFKLEGTAKSIYAHYSNQKLKGMNDESAMKRALEVVKLTKEHGAYTPRKDAQKELDGLLTVNMTARQRQIATTSLEEYRLTMSAEAAATAAYEDATAVAFQLGAYSIDDGAAFGSALTSLSNEYYKVSASSILQDIVGEDGEDVVMAYDEAAEALYIQNADTRELTAYTLDDIRVMTHGRHEDSYIDNVLAEKVRKNKNELTTATNALKGTGGLYR